MNKNTKYKTFLAALLVFVGICAVSARVYDDCTTREYLHYHSVDMIIDYRNAANYLNDVGRFKRDMRNNLNRNPDANKFFLAYKSASGFNCFYARLYFLDGTSEERHFFISTDNINKVELTPSQYIESGRVYSSGGWYYRDLWMTSLPDRTHFIELRFADWVFAGAVNYWSPQVSDVSFWEAGDPICGNGVCGGTDARGRPESCWTCPQDCGNCPIPTCGNGVCELGEGWALKTGEYAIDLGYLTCPEDCGGTHVCGNRICDPTESCGAQTQFGCSGDCCTLFEYSYFTPGACGDGKCNGAETCGSCAADCGACPQCGDGRCNGDETCSNCAQDCGACPARVLSNCILPGLNRPPVTSPPPPTPPPPIPAPVPVATPVTTPPPPTPVPAPTPVATPPPSGTGIPIPGIVEVENYNTGGQNVGYFDTTPGNSGGALRTDDVDVQTCTDSTPCYAIGYIDPTEWLHFTVNVATTGIYNINARYAYPDGTPITAQRLITVKVDGVQVAQLSLAPTGGWATWATSPNFQTSVPLTAGTHTLRLEFSQGWWSLNYLRFTLLTAAPVATPVAAPVTPPVAAPVRPPVVAPIAAPVATPVASPPSSDIVTLIPGRLSLSNYRTGGEGVAYHDLDAINHGSASCRGSEGVDMEAITRPDGSSACAVGWMSPGEWIKYRINGQSTGTYKITVRYSYPALGTPIVSANVRTFRLQLDALATYGTFSLPPASAGNDWAFNTYTATWSQTISAGLHDLTFYPDSEWWRIDYIDFALA